MTVSLEIKIFQHVGISINLSTLYVFCANGDDVFNVYV